MLHFTLPRISSLGYYNRMTQIVLLYCAQSKEVWIMKLFSRILLRKEMCHVTTVSKAILFFVSFMVGGMSDLHINYFSHLEMSKAA